MNETIFNGTVLNFSDLPLGDVIIKQPPIDLCKYYYMDILIKGFVFIFIIIFLYFILETLNNLDKEKKVHLQNILTSILFVIISVLFIVLNPDNYKTFIIPMIIIMLSMSFFITKLPKLFNF